MYPKINQYKTMGTINKTITTMKNVKTIVAECYEALPTLPGYFKSFNALSKNVNNTLCANSMKSITDKELRSAILSAWPKAKFEDGYEHDGTTMCAVRIIITKEVVLSDEEKSRLQTAITNVLTTNCCSENGWYDLVLIAPRVKEGGVDYKTLGFAKFGDMLAAIFGDKIKMDDRGDKTKKYVRIEVDGLVLNSKVSQTTIKPCATHKTREKTDKRKRISAYDKLMSFAIFPQKDGKNGFNAAIKQLAEKALPENWFYGTSENDPGTYPILRSYFLYTFERLLAEDEEHACDADWEHKIIVKDRNAVFNTGLVDRLYEPIYAVFNRNFNESSDIKWFFWTFVKSNDKEHQQLTRVFGTNLPAPAHYYNSSSELVYNIGAKIGSYNWDHFIDHCDRLPKDFLMDNGPEFDYEHLNSKGDYKRLAEMIKADGRCMNRIKNRIQDAIEHAIKRVRWNFKTAIPIYYPGQKQISLLLPLALVDEDMIDVALVLEATKDAYIAHTILTLDMAYNNARLITRPQSDWLAAEKISVCKKGQQSKEVE